MESHPGNKKQKHPYSPFYRWDAGLRWCIWCHHTEHAIYWKFGMTHLTSRSGQCLFTKCSLAKPGPQPQLSAWDVAINKASSLDYECTGTCQCRKVTRQVLPLHIHLKSVVAYRKKLGKCQFFWAQIIQIIVASLESSWNFRTHTGEVHCEDANATPSPVEVSGSALLILPWPDFWVPPQILNAFL